MKLLKAAAASFLLMGALAVGMPSTASAFWPHGHNHWQQWHQNRDSGWNRYHPYSSGPGNAWNWNQRGRYANGLGNVWNGNWNRYHPYPGAPGNGWSWNQQLPVAGGPGNVWGGNWNRYHPSPGGPAYGRNGNQYSQYGGGPFAYNNAYNNPGHQVLPPNGEGMINLRNPNLYWACNGQGTHCHWARRF
ncbi:MAG TPA: hypothetical protein VMU41_10515 [Candidatus Binataceae bacterium]|nr:hypothetical protein [Candidatus Binataceae bacterium]